MNEKLDGKLLEPWIESCDQSYTSRSKLVEAFLNFTLWSLIFNAINNNLDNGAECNLRKLSDYTKLERTVNTSECRATLRRDLYRLERWADKNLEKFNKRKWKIPYLRRNNPILQYSQRKQLSTKRLQYPGGPQAVWDSSTPLWWCTVWGSPVHEKHGHTGVDPAERHQKEQETAALEVQREAEKTGFIQF